ncbi:MAG: hypothetical protein KJ607_07170, partial [Bacteroidetes bacterium]|nr:hypothetical protein [Bacteroidota bacterium]
IPRLPGFRVSYTPVIQRNDSMYYYSNALTASVSHRYRTGKIIHVTTLIYNVIKSDNNLSDSEIRYSAEHYTLNHVLSFKIPLSIMLNGGYVLSACPDSSYNSVIGGLSASYQYKRWNNSAGISLIHSENQDMRKGYFYRSSLNFAKNFTFSLQIENNIYDHFVLSEIYPDYREYLIRASLMYRW